MSDPQNDGKKSVSVGNSQLPVPSPESCLPLTGEVRQPTAQVILKRLLIVLIAVSVLVLLLVVSRREPVFSQQLASAQAQLAAQASQRMSEGEKPNEQSSTVEEHAKASTSSRQTPKEKSESSVKVPGGAGRKSSSISETPKSSHTAFNPGSIRGAPEKLENPHIVIDIPYAAEPYLLPIDFARKDKNGNGIAETLYSSDLIQKREKFQAERISFMDSRIDNQQANLAKFNNPLNEKAAKEGIEANQKQWTRLNSKFQLEKLSGELFMCIMIPSFNNNANFRIEYNLNSVFMQNYTNFKAVIIDDASTDGSKEAYRKYFAFHRIDKHQYTYIESKRRVGALHNTYLAAMNHCPSRSIVLNLDGDDELIGRNVLSLYNWGYQTRKTGVLYSNFLWYYPGRDMISGFTEPYSSLQLEGSLYREVPMKFSHLRSFWNQLIFEVNPRDLQDDGGVFFKVSCDISLFFPLMELSCGRVYKIEEEFPYLYTTGTGLNLYSNRDRQMDVENEIRARKKYACSKAFSEGTGY